MATVLVAYGSKHGSTAEIAERIGAVLREAGHAAEVRDAGDVDELDRYAAIVLGSAVYGGRWRRPARRLLRRLRGELDGRPLWVFSSGPYGDTEIDPGDRWQNPPKIRAAAEKLGAREATVFGGRVPTEPSNFMERSMVEKLAPEHRDARDFEAIAGWARAIADELAS